MIEFFRVLRFLFNFVDNILINYLYWSDCFATHNVSSNLIITILLSLLKSCHSPPQQTLSWSASSHWVMQWLVNSPWLFMFVSQQQQKVKNRKYGSRYWYSCICCSVFEFHLIVLVYWEEKPAGVPMAGLRGPLSEKLR